VSRRRRARRGGGRTVLTAVVGMVLGAAAGAVFSGAFVVPGELDRSQWRVISPVLDETLSSPGLGRGAHVVDGALVIREHAFHAADALQPLVSEPPVQVEVTLVDGSDPLVVFLDSDASGPRTALQLTATHYAGSAKGAAWVARDDTGPWQLISDDQGVWLSQAAGRVQLARAPLEGLELTALEGAPAVDHLTLYSASGAVLFDDGFAPNTHPALPVGVGGLLGFVWGLALAGSASGGTLASLVWGVLPLVVVALPDTTWLALVERAYLTRTPYWTLSRMVLGLSLLPLLLLAVLRHDATTVRRGTDRPARWLGPALAMAASSVAGLHGPVSPVEVVFGGLVVLSPVVLLPWLRIHERAWWLGDVPALLGLASLGWYAGFPLVVAWRTVRLAGSARFFLDHAPRAGVNLLLGGVLVGVLAVEWGVRFSYLNTVWHHDALAGGPASDSDWREAVATWTGTCGAEPAERVVRVAWAGGSSTGGAFQFKNNASQFFPAQVHQSLCDALPAGARLWTSNFGDGGRDTFTIAHTVDQMLGEPTADLLVLYIGVNDVLTDSGGTPRRERAAWSERFGPLSGLVGVSRALTGVGLILRPPRVASSEADTFVPEVPLPHAEDNLRAIAAATSGSTRVLLMPEVLRTEVDGTLTDYTRMLHRVAADHDHVQVVEPGVLLAGEDRAVLMADRNHFSRVGSERMGAVLTPIVADLLGLPADAP